jgi:putative sterol carrier protein
MMSIFRDVDEVYRHLGGLFEYVVADETLADVAAATGLVARLGLTDPDCVLVVDFPGRKVFLGEAGTGAAAAFELDMAADVAHAVWLGHIPPATLLATRRVRVRGSARKLLRMQSLGERLIPVYEKLLLDANREDLLAAPA